MQVTLLVIPEGAEPGSVPTSLCPSARVVHESFVSKRSLALRAGRLPTPPPPPTAAAITAAARCNASAKCGEAAGAGSVGNNGGNESGDSGTGVPTGGEKRAARERRHSAASRARAERALSERLYLLERRDLSERSESGRHILKHQFAVLGSTGEHRLPKPSPPRPRTQRCHHTHTAQGVHIVWTPPCSLTSGPSY